ncbi:MAG: hypothetical protein DRP00_00280 [Candidatus Aenigmatarchaeota archaeon]|nr:MAG: hypothetical protein DRP00_00280 [Candidatus Aenigmarchaeota archaeon]
MPEWNIWGFFAGLSFLIGMLIIALTHPNIKWMQELGFWIFMGLGGIGFFAFWYLADTPLDLVYVFGSIFIIFSFISGIYTVYQLPSDFQRTELPPFVKGFFNALGLPPEWLYMPAIFYLFVIPFLTLFAIIEGIMGKLEDIFGRWTHVIAFGITFMCIPTQILTLVAQGMFAALGMYALAIFIFLFVIAGFSTVIQGLHKTGFTKTGSYRTVAKEIVVESKFNQLFKYATKLMDKIPTIVKDVKKQEELLEKLGKALDKSSQLYFEEKVGEAIGVLAPTVKDIEKELSKIEKESKKIIRKEGRK